MKKTPGTMKSSTFGADAPYITATCRESAMRGNLLVTAVGVATHRMLADRRRPGLTGMGSAAWGHDLFSGRKAAISM
jgi:hypothetical protein